jgi:hypothetical protein
MARFEEKNGGDTDTLVRSSKQQHSSKSSKQQRETQ